ncbi:MAG: cytosine deaminase [Cyanobacteria bacterium J06648_11]
MLDPAIAATLARPDWEGLVQVDLEIVEGAIAQIVPVGDGQPGDVELRGGQVWPCFADMHVHLDKAHIWPRSSNPDGTFASALETVARDRDRYWQVEDLYRRMDFTLRCCYAHGTQAIRTHLDAFAPQAEISFEVFRRLRQEWRDRVELQAVCLVPLDYFLTDAGEPLADLVADSGAILGGVTAMGEELDAQLDRVFALATDRHLDLDFHADESGNPEDMTLRYVANTAIASNFSGQIVCGHCCSLAVQSPDVATETIARVRDAGIGIVSLPMCNTYLQDRQQQASRGVWDSEAIAPQLTPRWRGVTLLHELKSQGIPVAVANDNCRDPFHAFGDGDMLEVFAQSAKIAHFDMPYGDWPQAVTTTPAHLMGLPELGAISLGAPADLVLFRGRSFSELLARPQSDRVVLRGGKAIDTTLPDYSELDDLVDDRSSA